MNKETRRFERHSEKIKAKRAKSDDPNATRTPRTHPGMHPPDPPVVAQLYDSFKINCMTLKPLLEPSNETLLGNNKSSMLGKFDIWSEGEHVCQFIG